MGSGFPEELVVRLAGHYGIRRAVETGTYLGEGTRALARHFQSVETIELSRRLALRAKLVFALNRRVTVRYGSSADLLTPATEPTLYWLDGHWSGGTTAGQSYECPVIAELAATSPGTARDCYLIDDARLFLNPPPPPHNPEQWPSFSEIKATVKDLRPLHRISIEDDVIVIEPPHETTFTAD
jgi:hypothetical protein